MIRMEDDQKILILYTLTGILEGLNAPKVYAYGAIPMVMMLIVSLVVLKLIVERTMGTKEFTVLFGNGIWPYLSVLLVVWVLMINL